ncbi:hypothetical protein SDC9_124441 [bioreactor metagenome]|uniref:Uncharacterized protein n=1 Tax=bioreactor metagenome TaxID=1076179 RepID=A0A645CKL0_9ZZZZ
MNCNFNKFAVVCGSMVLLLVLLAGCSDQDIPVKPSASETGQVNATTANQQISETDGTADSNNTTAPSSSAGIDTVLYQNDRFGFTFALPEDWGGYSIIQSQWEGLIFSGDSGEKVAETGPILSIRNPSWTSQNPQQDIPIMIFTQEQWDDLQQNKFHIGAAPIGPSQLGHNDQYVFATPARYNSAFLEGYEEVDSILASNPFQCVDG